MPRKLNQILHISVHSKKIGNKDRAKVFSANPWPVFFAHWWQVQGRGEGFEDLMGWLGETFVGSVFGLCCGGDGGLWCFCCWWWWWYWSVSLIFSVGKIVMRRNQPQGCFYVSISMTGLFSYFAILPFGCFVILFILLLKASLTKYQAFQIFACFKLSYWFWCIVVFWFSRLHLLLICFVSMILVCSSGSGQVLWRSGGNLQKLNIAARFAIKGHRIYHVVSRFRNISFIFVTYNRLWGGADFFETLSFVYWCLCS